MSGMFKIQETVDPPNDCVLGLTGCSTYVTEYVDKCVDYYIII